MLEASLELPPFAAVLTIFFVAVLYHAVLLLIVAPAIFVADLVAAASPRALGLTWLTGRTWSGVLVRAGALAAAFGIVAWWFDGQSEGFVARLLLWMSIPAAAVGFGGKLTQRYLLDDMSPEVCRLAQRLHVRNPEQYPKREDAINAIRSEIQDVEKTYTAKRVLGLTAPATVLGIMRAVSGLLE